MLAGMLGSLRNVKASEVRMLVNVLASDQGSNPAAGQVGDPVATEQVSLLVGTDVAGRRPVARAKPDKG